MPPRVKIQTADLIVEKEGEITVSISVLNLSDYFSSLSHPPVKAVMRVRDAAIFFTLDGSTDPTTATGMPLYQDEELTLDEPYEIRNMKFIEAAGTPILHYVFYKSRD